MLFSEIIFNVKNLLSGGIESDDENLSNNQLAFIINYYRAKLLKQKEDRGLFTKQLFVQNLGNTELIIADKNECCDVNQCILRTKFKVPKPMNERSITFVGLVNGKPFQISQHNKIIWELKDKWTGKEPKWYWQNGYIYIVNSPSNGLKIINIQGIFENPLIVNKFNTCKCEDDECSNAFDSFDFEYPMPMSQVDIIVKLIAETEIRLLLSLPSDITNDGLDQANLNGGSK
jgi:hypothetical protein